MTTRHDDPKYFSQPATFAAAVDLSGATITPPSAERTLATADELAAMDRGLAAMAGPADLAAAIAEASADFDVDLLSAGVSDTALVAGPIGKRAILALAAWHLLKTDPSAVSRAERYHARYQELRNNLLVGADKAKTARLNENNAKQAPDVRGWFAVAW